MLMTVALSVEEYEQLHKLARHRADMDAETLLRCLVGDLIGSVWTGGSDERMYAEQWFERRFGNEWVARELAKDRKAAKRPAAQPVERKEPQEDYFDKLVAKQKGGSK
jgi:hypothetical protein